MFSALARFFASLSLSLKQPLSAFCEVETAHGEALVTKAGHYLSWIRVGGMQRMGEAKDFTAHLGKPLRLDLSGALDAGGHAIVGWYISDPDAALVEIEHLNLRSCREIARQSGPAPRRHPRRAGASLAEADALGGLLFHRLDEDFGADQGGAQSS